MYEPRGGPPPKRGGGGGGKKAKALFDYYGENPTDLSFRKGDIISITSENASSGPEWWQGEIGGKRGSFPINHVEVLQDAINSYDNSSSYSNNAIPMTTYNNNSSSYGNNSSSYGNNNNSYGNSSPKGYGYTPSSSPTSNSSYNSSSTFIPSSTTSNSGNSNEESPKPAKSFSGGGGGGDSEKKIKVGLGIAVFILLLSFIGIIFPWYYNTSGPKVEVYQWDGVGSYDPPQKAAAVKLPTTDFKFLKTFKAANYKNFKTLMAVSLTFMLLSVIATIIQIIMWNHLRKGNELNNKIVLAITVITFLLYMIAVFQFLQFPKTFKKDTNIAIGPATGFSGKTDADSQWGPGLGWIMATLAMCFSFINIIISYLVIRDNGGLSG